MKLIQKPTVTIWLRVDPASGAEPWIDEIEEQYGGDHAQPGRHLFGSMPPRPSSCVRRSDLASLLRVSRPGKGPHSPGAPMHVASGINRSVDTRLHRTRRENWPPGRRATGLPRSMLGP